MTDTYLNYEDYRDFYDAARGFIAEMTEPISQWAGEERVIWDIHGYDQLLGEPLRFPDNRVDDDNGAAFQDRIAKKLAACPQTVNASLWRQALLNNMHGLYQVTQGVYQVRGYDLANLTIVETRAGLVVIDCTTACETAAAALNLYWQAVDETPPVVAVILTHTHVDHYGGTQGVLSANAQRFGEGEIPIIAPEDFVPEAVLENALVGDAMVRRSNYMYGLFLPVTAAGDGKVDAGLGKDSQRGGSVGFALPTVTVVENVQGLGSQPSLMEGYAYAGLPLELDGVDFEFMLCPGTEAPAEMTIWLPKQNCLVAAEVATHTLHNLLTPRGAEIRDARLWWKALDKLLAAYGEEIAALCATHHWPVWEEACLSLLAEQRDSYKYLHDQTVRLINKGYTMLEIAAWFDEADNLPEVLKARWHNRGYYGTISHDVRAIYQKYLGWYDMNPANLNPLPPTAVAERYVRAMGGEEAVIRQLRAFGDKATAEDLRWAAELGKHLVFANPNPENSELLASIYERLGYACEAGTWRNMYLVAARELRGGGPLVKMAATTANPAILQAMDDDLLADFMAAHFRAEGALGQETVSLVISQRDRNTRLYFTTGAGVLNFHGLEDEVSAPAREIFLDRATLVRLILKEETVATAFMKGELDFSGEADADDVTATQGFFDLQEKGDANFNIALP